MSFFFFFFFLLLELFNFFIIKCWNFVLTMWNIFLLVKEVHLTTEKSCLQNRWSNCYAQTNTTSEYRGAQEGPNPPWPFKNLLRSKLWPPHKRRVWICTVNVDVLWKPNIRPKCYFCTWMAWHSWFHNHESINHLFMTGHEPTRRGTSELLGHSHQKC